MKKLKTALIVFAIFLGSLVLLELAFRVYDYFSPSPVFYDMRYKRYRGKPLANEYTLPINSDGFKDTEFKYDKENGVYRILCTGDSNMWGVVPYNYNFSNLLEEKLTGPSKKFEVYNVGLPCIGPHDYLSILMHEAIPRHPDMYIVCFSMADDFGTRKWYMYFKVAALVKYFIDANTTFRENNPMPEGTVYREDVKSLPDDVYLEYSLKKTPQYSTLPDRQQSIMFEKTMWYLKRIDEVCKKRNIPLVIVFIPVELQINKNLQKTFLSKLTEQVRKTIDFSLPNKMLGQEFEKLHIPYIDLLPGFIEETDKKNIPYYLPNDYHWNKAGNTLAAKLLFEKLSLILKSKGADSK